MTEIQRPDWWPPIVRHDDECCDASWRCAKQAEVEKEIYRRLTYRLGYHYEPDRVLDKMGMSGPELADRDDPERKSSGDWNDAVCDYDDDPVLQTMTMAVCEAVHEALEFLRLDGRLLLDPHGQYEVEVSAASRDCAARLFTAALMEANQRGAP